MYMFSLDCFFFCSNQSCVCLPMSIDAYTYYDGEYIWNRSFQPPCLHSSTIMKHETKRRGIDKNKTSFSNIYMSLSKIEYWVYLNNNTIDLSCVYAVSFTWINDFWMREKKPNTCECVYNVTLTSLQLPVRTFYLFHLFLFVNLRCFFTSITFSICFGRSLGIEWFLVHWIVSNYILSTFFNHYLHTILFCERERERQ